MRDLLISLENASFLQSKNAPDLSASVGPDLAAADVQRDEEEDDRHLGLHGEGLDAVIQTSDYREDDHEEL